MANRSASFQGRDHFPAGFRILQGKQEFITYTDHSSVRLWASNTANHYDTHAHSAVEVIMPSEGTSVYQLTDETYSVKPGQILFVPSGCPHALTEGGDTSRYLLLFEPAPLLALQDMADISLMLQKPIYLRDDTEDRQTVHRYLMELVDCYKQQQPMWNTQCYSYILQCYALMGRSFLHTTTPAAAQSHWRIDPEIMNSAMTFINEHYMEDISLEDAAAFVGFSKWYFSRTFKEFFGRPFSELLLYTRVNEAANLLMQTDDPVLDVAKRAGFQSIATFNRVFREAKNCTPTQFRSIYGKQIHNPIQSDL